MSESKLSAYFLNCLNQESPSNLRLLNIKIIVKDIIFLHKNFWLCTQFFLNCGSKIYHENSHGVKWFYGRFCN